MVCTLDRGMRGPRARRRDPLLELDEVERRLKPFGRRYLGVREIPLDALVGTDGRASSFTRDFRPLHSFSRERMRSLQSAFAEGAFPPIVTVKLGETYFVIDGHHRAALARRAGADVIDADVTELIARVPLPAGADMLEHAYRDYPVEALVQLAIVAQQEPHTPGEAGAGSAGLGVGVLLGREREAGHVAAIICRQGQGQTAPA